ncbi:hypothetical protein LTR53_007163 [Teratosphaeriaceae sp. CCFEE 6253]|nr:hypothetical protein LTR53_007163 [Teratosphaeriaceae sp. CCFEE 6253]
MTGPHEGQFTVRLINAAGHILHYRLPSEGAAELVHKAGTFTWRAQGWLPNGESIHDIIAVLRSDSSTRLSLETRARACSVTSTLPSVRSSQEPDHPSFSHSTKRRDAYSSVCVSESVTITYQQHQLELRVSRSRDMSPRHASLSQQPLAPPAIDDKEDTIAVKHRSPAKAEADNDPPSTSDTDVNNDPDASPRDAPLTEPTTIGTIAESPEAQKHDSAPASTGSVLDPDSPLHQKTVDSQENDSHLQAVDPARVPPVHSEELGEDENFITASAKKSRSTPLTTYGGRARSKATPISSRTVVGGEDVDVDIDNDVEHEPLQSSDARRDEHGTAAKVTSRSMRSVPKRRIDEVEAVQEGDAEEADAVDAEPAVPQKRRKGLPKTAQSDDEEAYAVEEERAVSQKRRKGLPEAAQSDDEDAHVGEEEPATSPKRRKGLPKAAQSDDEEAHAVEEEPAVPPKRRKGLPKAAQPDDEMDPIVVIHRPATTSTNPKSAGRTKKSTPGSKHDAKATPASVSTAGSAMEGKVTKVLLSRTSLQDTSPAMKWLKMQGISVVDGELPTKRSNFLCVVPDGKLLLTAKVLRSLAMGKMVVTEDWISDSKEQGQLLDPPDYVHDDIDMSLDRSKLFAGMSVYFTRQLVADYGKEGWENVKQLVKEAGASSVDKGSAFNGENVAKGGQTVFVGSADGDADVAELRDEHGFTVYGKEMLTRSILHGELDLESGEFVLKAKTVQGKGKGKGKRR